LVLTSSQLSQVPQGVRPPAQFCVVPARLASAEIQRPLRKRSVVVPPPARAPLASTVPVS